uniref:Transglutaminase 4 n=1 Tax=Chelonoidis abingdonii TaxID=106734 RepID=A0A8C0HAX7_CHEAB
MIYFNTDNDDDGLKTLGVDLLQKQNARLHHTEEYHENNSLIVRRGQVFQLNHTSSVFCIDLFPGEKPMKSNKTLLSMDLRSGQDSQWWCANISNTSEKECLVAVTSPADAAVGKYFLSVKTARHIYNPGNKVVYVLFNPWCEADTVFMPNDTERLEYVLSDTGSIYVGSVQNIVGRPWNFGQFEEDVLDSCMYLLDKSKLKQKVRKDPVIVSRAMSALVNSNDESGVLFGNWSGTYTGGTSPVAWTGSAPILQKYYKTKKPIRFGQCWVFSGVLTTVMRCLGIPARSVTNFASAHDTEENLKVDIYMNEKGEKLDDMTSDSVWNFHVWNDVWMKRPDLPQGFDGWQALDATPQEISQGVYQCGPCPLKAIRSGEVYLLYDSKFVFAEVNADRVFWQVKNVNGKQKLVKLREEIKTIGKNISTKAVGKNTREDITAQYKFPEGSPEERKAVEKACSYLNSSNLAVCESTTPLPPLQAGIQLDVESEKVLWLGNPINLNIIVQNSSAGAWTINLVASCQLQSYTSKVKANLGSIKQTVQTEGKPGGSMNLSYPMYFTCSFIFKNTLSIPLEECKLHVEGLGIFKMETIDQGDIMPGRIIKSQIICAPNRTGEKKIVAKLTSNQVKGISGEKMITITA